MNEAQQILVASYGGGDFAWVTTEAEAKDVGDTLFTFLFIELSDVEGEEAISRCETAINDIHGVIDALNNCT